MRINELYPFVVCAERPLPLSGTFVGSGAVLHRASSSGVDHGLEKDRQREILRLMFRALFLIHGTAKVHVFYRHQHFSIFFH